MGHRKPDTVIGLLDPETLSALTAAVRQVSPAGMWSPKDDASNSSWDSSSKESSAEQSQQEAAMHDLRDAGIHISGASLRRAAAKGLADTCGLLVRAGVHVDELDACGRTALTLAARAGHLSVVITLVSCGADINCEDNNKCIPLLYACNEGHARIVDYLACHSGITEHWQDALLIGAREGHTDVCRLLCKRGLCPTASDDSGWTGLMYASWNGALDLCDLLLQYGADVNAASRHGETSLMLAVRGGYKKVVTLLCRSGADVHARTTDGLTSMDVARRNQRPSAMQVLLDHGAETGDADDAHDSAYMVRPALFP